MQHFPPPKTSVENPLFAKICNNLRVGGSPLGAAQLVDLSELKSKHYPPIEDGCGDFWCGCNHNGYSICVLPNKIGTNTINHSKS